MNKINVKIFISFLIWLFAQSSLAFENLGSASAALGGAGVGAINATDGTFNNPASVALFERKAAVVGTGYKTFRAIFSDNGEDALFPAALGYNQQEVSGVKTRAFHLVLAKAIEDQFAFGLNIHAQETKVDAINDDTYRQNVLDLATVVKVNEWLTLGLVYKNKALSDTELKDFYDNNPRLIFGLELAYVDVVDLRLETESAQNISGTQKQAYKTGLEIQLNDWLLARLGYQNNNILSQNYFTAGMGFGGPQFGLHYAYVKESNFEKDSYHSVDLAIPF